MKRTDIILLLVAVVLIVLPLVLVKAPADGSGFQGSDGQAQSLIGKMAPGFKPTFQPVWTPPSKEVETLIFSLQAAMGCGFLGYYVGLRVGKRRASQESKDA